MKKLVLVIGIIVAALAATTVHAQDVDKSAKVEAKRMKEEHKAEREHRKAMKEEAKMMKAQHKDENDKRKAEKEKYKELKADIKDKHKEHKRKHDHDE